MGLEHLALGLGTGAVIIGGFIVGFSYATERAGTYLDNKRTERLRREYPDKDISESYYWRNRLQFP